MKKLRLIKPWNLKTVCQRLDCNTSFAPHTQAIAACGPRHTTEYTGVNCRTFFLPVMLRRSPETFAAAAKGPRG